MTYVLKFYALYWIIALIGGVLVGLLTWESRQRAGWFSGWTAWATILFLVGLVLALLKLFAGRSGHYLELALIFFCAYIAGCWLGAMIRTMFAPAREDLQTKDRQAGAAPAMALATAGASATGATGSPGVIPQSKDAGTRSAYGAAGSTSGPGAPAIAAAGAVAAPTGSASGAAPAATGTPKPAGLAGPRGGKVDDLKLVRGIGRQNEERLHGLGVYHFDQIAAWTKENVEWVGDFLAFPGRIEREDWVGQAKLLAAGAQTDFSKRVTSGGVPTSIDADAAALLADAHPGAKPPGLTAARDNRPDDLKKIRGIGRQNEDRLHRLGVYHFDQIAAWTGENVDWVGSFLAFPGRIEREKWVAQARKLAAGQDTEFSRRVAGGDVPTSKD